MKKRRAVFRNVALKGNKKIPLRVEEANDGGYIGGDKYLAPTLKPWLIDDILSNIKTHTTSNQYIRTHIFEISKF